MEINPTERRIPEVAKSEIYRTPQEIIKDLESHIESYFCRFKEMFSQPMKLDKPDFVPLELLGHEVKVAAGRVKEEIQTLSKSSPEHAQKLRELYHKRLEELHKGISDIANEVLPPLWSEIEEKFTGMGSKKSVNVPAVRELLKAVQQNQLLLEKVKEEKERIQSLIS